MSVAGLLLAAGAGRRYGRPKALAEGGAWLRGALAALVGGGCFPVRVVLGAEADAAARLLPDPDLALVAANWQAGMSASLNVGLAAMHEVRPLPDAVVVHLVDLPDVNAAAVHRMVQSCHGPRSLARAVYQGRPGHPVLLGRQHWLAISEAVHGDVGARDWLNARADDVTYIDCSDLANGSDIDTGDEQRDGA